MGQESPSQQGRAASLAERLRDALAAWVGWSHDHYALVIAVVLAVTAVAGVFAVKLLQDVRTDFGTLLPDDDRSVQDLRTLNERYGGAQSLYLIVDSPDVEANKRFVDDLTAKLEAASKEWGFLEVRSRVGSEGDFIAEHRFLYLNLEDLEEIEERLRDRTRWEKCAKSPFCVQLDEKPEFRIDDIERKYKSNLADTDERSLDGYFSNSSGNLMAVVLKVRASETSLSYARKLHKWLRATGEELGPASYHPELKLLIWGGMTKRIYEYRLIIDDTLRTAGITILLVCFVIYLYFRRIRPVLFMSASVLVAIVWTFALTYFYVGYLNQQTAFLGSIIIGNGINFSLIFMARYLEERRRGGESRESLLVAARNTGGATSTAALATAIAYGVLLFARFKGFSQFGFMGSVGMLLCWAFTFALCPALLALSERIRPFVPRFQNRDPSHGRFGTEGMAQFVEESPGAIVVLGVALTLVSGFYISRLMKDPFEYDFTKLGVSLQDTDVWEAALGVAEIFARREAAPQVILTDSLEESRMAVEALDAKKKEPDGSLLGRISWYGSLIPDQQEEKLEVMKEIRRIVDTQPMGWLKPKQRYQLEELRESLSLETISPENVPPRLLDQLREKDGTLGRVVLAYPNVGYRMANGRNQIRFANQVRELQLSNGKVIHSSGGGVIFADMLHTITRDGPLITLICYLGVIIALLLNFRSLGTTLFLMFFLTYGLVLLGGAMGLLDIKVNFFNFIVIPITVGIGVDYHINVYKRYQLDGKHSITAALRGSGGAVVLCSLTTIIGYGMMMTAATQAMVSFGLMAVIGEVTCLTSALLLKPAVIILGERRRAGTSGSAS